jgi:hypothetical protein
MTEYPNNIKISGLPILWHGWNSVLHKSDQKGEDDTPIYRLDPYILYHIFPIIGITVLRQNGKWIMLSDNSLFPIIRKESKIDDYEIMTSYEHLNRNTGPVGIWTYGVKVYPC